MKKSEIINFPSNNENLCTPIKPKVSSAQKTRVCNSVSPITLNLFSKRVVKIGELSENAYSKFYESSIYMSPEQRINRYHRKLNSLSKILDKKFPTIKSRQLDKFVLYEHGLLQIFRVISNSILKKKLHALKEIKFTTITRNKQRKLITNLMSIYIKNRRAVFHKYIKKWKNCNGENQCILNRFNKIFIIVMNRNFNDLKDAFSSLCLFSLKHKIQKLMQSNWTHFQKEEQRILDEKKLKKKLAFFSIFYLFEKYHNSEIRKNLNFAFRKMVKESIFRDNQIKVLAKFLLLLRKKGKKIVFSKIDEFSRRMRMLKELMHSFRIKTLIKSFWALRHWKSIKNEDITKYKAHFALEKIKKLLIKSTKNSFENLKKAGEKRLKHQDKSKILRMKLRLFQILKEKINERKMEGFNEINKLSLLCQKYEEKFLENTFFMVRLVDLLIEKAKRELKQYSFFELKRFFER